MIKDKLKAFFHDSLDSTFNIQNRNEKSIRYFKLTGIEENLFDESIENSDQFVSSADRINLPDNVNIDFNGGILTHPLCGGSIKISEYGYTAPKDDELEQTITKAIEKIKSESKDEKRFLISLWRNIPDIFIQYEIKNLKIRNIFNLLPADTRIPDHSLLDHNWLTSAIISSLPDIALLKFSIGPENNFIYSSKRVKDIWLGSHILSYLSLSAIEIIINEFGPEHIIFPYIKGQPLIDKFLKEKYSISFDSIASTDIPTLSNTIFAILPADKSKVIADKMKKSVRDSFRDIAKDIKSMYDEFLGDSKITNVWNKQVDSFIEFHYTIYKCANDVETLKKQYKQIFGTDPLVTVGKYPNPGNFWQHIYKILSASFDSRASLVYFEQEESKDRIRRCSMCGEREILYPQDINSESEIVDFWKRIGRKYSSKIDKKGKDNLCAICFIKRNADEYFFKNYILNDVSFPSASAISALSFKLKVIENWQKTFYLIENYNGLLRCIRINPKKLGIDLEKYLHEKTKDLYKANNGRIIEEIEKFLSYDGQWIYKESFKESYLISKGIVKDALEYSHKKEIIDIILKTIGSMGKVVNDKPSPYFAVLSMSGDEMEQWIDGTHKDFPMWKDVVHPSIINSISDDVKNQKRNLSPTIHSFIGKALNNFSLNFVRDIVENQFSGKLIYSNGDKLLAFLPIDSVLRCAEKIRFAFSGNINEKGYIDLENTSGYILLKDKRGEKILPTMGNKATMSAGIVIANRKHGLEDVIQTAIEIQSEARNIYQGDFFAIKILALPIIEHISKWRHNDIRIIENINSIITNLSVKTETGGLSLSFVESMIANFDKLKIADLLKPMVRLELKRHLKLKEQEEYASEDLAEKEKLLLKDLEARFINLINTQKNEFRNILSIIKFLARGR